MSRRKVTTFTVYEEDKEKFRQLCRELGINELIECFRFVLTLLESHVRKLKSSTA